MALSHFMKNLLPIIILTFTIISCSGKKYPTIELNHLDKDLKESADQMTTDFFTLGKTETGFQEFRKMGYITPLAHRSLINPNSAYSWTPWILENHLGKIYAYNLFEVIDKGVVKSMRYKIDCELRPDELVEFRIDVNEQNRLSKIYLYLYDAKTNETRNVFEGSYIKI